MLEPRTQRTLARSVILRFLLAFFVSGLLFSGLILAIYHQDVVNQRTILAKESEHVLDLQQELIHFELQGVQSDLLYLVTQDNLQDFLLDNSAARIGLEKEYKNFALKKAVYDQIRFLDVTGLEMVRINYNAGKAESVPPTELQSKASRYYFRQARSLDRGEVLVSSFDLNVEHGEIEQPIEPVIRFITPVFGESNEKQGFLVLNYLGSPLLAKLRQLASSFRGEAMLVNPTGEYLQAPDSSHEWGWVLDHKHSFRNDFPDAWREGERLGTGQFRIGDDSFTFQRLSPGVRFASPRAQESATSVGEDRSDLVLVARVSDAVANAHSRDLLDRLLLMFAGVMAVAALLAYYWARSAEIHRNHELRIAESESRLRHLSSALLEAQETERRNLSRVLHDELGQSVTAIRLDLGSLAKDMSDSESSKLVQRLIKATDELLSNLHEIASGARPSLLDDLGLSDAVESFVSEYQQRTGIEVTSHLLLDQETIPAKIGENAYRIVAEALSNVARHAKVGHAKVTMENDGERLRVSVEDFGRGFRIEDIEASTRLGILGMRERAELLNGTFNLSSSPGKGTQILVELPWSGPSAMLNESNEV